MNNCFGAGFALVLVIFVICVDKCVGGSNVDNRTSYNEDLRYNNEDIGYSPNSRSYRKSKFFPLFTIIRFTNEICKTTSEEGGICYTRKQCTLNGGTAAGTCAQGLGVCCQFHASCGAIITQNGTLFRNPNFPQKYQPAGGSDVCQVRIRKPQNVCQLRLNFHKFDVEGPLGSQSSPGNQMPSQEAGMCKNDALSITSSGATVPQLCGQMGGQHLYVDFGTSDTITMNLLLGGNVQRDREWSIEILMIPCNSVSRAPVGCLQYYTGVSGQVESFNNPGAIHLANQDYSVCIRMEDGMRSIEWSGCQPGSVRISGPTPLPTVTGGNNQQPIQCPVASTGTGGVQGQGSAADYLVIMGGIQYPLVQSQNVQNPTAPVSTSDRYCDASFALQNYVVRSTVRPFILHFKTDGMEQTVANEASGGFCLKWQQNPQI